jgi:hypothetical protein
VECMKNSAISNIQRTTTQASRKRTPSKDLLSDLF